MIQRIDWNTILPVWRDRLWSGRKTDIKPTNGLKFLGGFDKNIEKNDPIFVGAYVNGKLVGVNSGHATNQSEYRSRGIYVFPEYRGRGIAQELLKAIEKQAIAERKGTLWSMPRASALKTYEKFGFEVVSDFFDDMEFGPNCFVVKLLEASYG
jgi:GNAT superfamily N-acetyltransferase